MLEEILPGRESGCGRTSREVLDEVVDGESSAARIEDGRVEMGDME